MLNRTIPFLAATAIATILAFTGCDTVKNTAGAVTNTAKGAVGAASDTAMGAAGAASNAAKGAAGAVTGGAYYAQETGTDGRLYIFGTEEEHAAYKAGNVGELWETAILAGPNGETIKFQVSKDGPELQNRLKTTFSAKNNVKL